jgi:hypothetical protein
MKKISLHVLGAGLLLFSTLGYTADLRFAVNAPRGSYRGAKMGSLDRPYE